MPGLDIRGFEHTGSATNVKVYDGMIFMDPCIVDDSVEIPATCSFIIEFIIPKFIEGSTCFERHAAHHQKL
jgi:hypothetical protein